MHWLYAENEHILMLYAIFINREIAYNFNLFGGTHMYHIIIEQTNEYKNRMKFDATKNIFVETEYESLAYIRNFPYPYGWIKESGTPPERHLDVMLLSSAKYKLGDEIEVKIIGCFVRNDGDNKLIGILPDRFETDFSELTDLEKAELNRLYPRVGVGEGWYGAERAEELVERFF